MNIKLMPSDGIIAELVELHKTMEFDDFSVEVIDIIKDLKQHEILIDDEELEIIDFDNTTNYDACIDHDMSMTYYKDGITELSVCRFGDPRGNYTDNMMVRLTQGELLGILRNKEKCTFVEHNGNTYKIMTSAGNNEIEIFDQANIDVAVCYSIEDIEDALNELNQ